MACPNHGIGAPREFVFPGRWRCLQTWVDPGHSSPGGWVSGPALSGLPGPPTTWVQPHVTPASTRICGIEYDVLDRELRAEEKVPYSNTLAAVAEIDAVLPSIVIPPRPHAPLGPEPDIFWLLGLAPWWAGGTFALWIIALHSNFVLSAILSGLACLAWLSGALGHFVLTGRTFRRALVRHRQLIRDAQDRDVARDRVLRSTRAPGDAALRASQL
jgi:hypothetical protein